MFIGGIIDGNYPKNKMIILFMNKVKLSRKIARIVDGYRSGSFAIVKNLYSCYFINEINELIVFFF